MQNRLYLNDGKGSFADATVSRLPTLADGTRALALGDVDGDGDLDLVVGNYLYYTHYSEQNRLYLNDGKGTFSDATSRNMPKVDDSTFSLALGDVDSDGDLDLVVGNGRRNRLHLNDGKGVFTDATATHLQDYPGITYALALGDVDGDGDLDLVEGHSLWPNRIHFNNGKGVFTHLPSANAIGGRARALALGDLDSDGDFDLVVGIAFEQDRLYLNDGKGSFRDATLTNLPKAITVTVSVALGDVDGDGDLDLLFGAYGESNNLYLNDGKGVFADATSSMMPKGLGPAVALVLEDVDGDGDLDLLAGVLDVRKRLYLNLHRQVDAPLLPLIGRPYVLDFYARPPAPEGTQTVLPDLSLKEQVPPVKIPGFGNFGLGAGSLVALPPLSIPARQAKASIRLSIPANASLVGQAFYVQAGIVHRQSPLQAGTTNVVAERITRL